MTSVVTSEGEEFSTQIADSVESFLLAVRAIAASGEGGSAVPLLLLEVSQVLLTGARLGAQSDFQPREEFQPDVGEEADVDELRMGLATILDSVDTYSFVFDPYEPEIVVSQISDDVASIVTDLENGLRHHRSVTSPRRCGGGSSATSTTGATWPARCSTRCSP